MAPLDTAETNCHLWRLDSILDDVRSPAEFSAAVAKQQQSSKGFFANIASWYFSGFSALKSTVPGTQNNLQRLMTSQMQAMPSDLPAADGDEADEEFRVPKEHAGPRVLPSIREGSGGRSWGASDLVAAAEEALATAAGDMTGELAVQEHSTPSAFERFAAAGAGSIDSTLRAGDSDSITSVLPGRSGSGSSSRMASYRSLTRKATMKHSTTSGPLLPRASTLQRMETSNAWWELHEMETKQNKEAAAAAPAAAAPAPAAAAASTDKDSRIDAGLAATRSGSSSSSSSSSGGRSVAKTGSGRSMSEGLLRALGGLSVLGISDGITTRLGALFKSQACLTPIYSSSLKKTAHTTLSTDGWSLHLVHCTDTSLTPQQRKHHPILMCPGLASSGPGTFDLLPKVSLVDYLAAAGYDVWVIDIRGNGLADKTSSIDLEQDWNIDDYLVQDVPACIEYVLKHSKRHMLHWMGHSMGGMLGSGLCSQGGKWSRKLRSVLLLGSGCFGDGSWHCLLKKLVVPITKFGFPAHITTQGLALLVNTPAALSVFETLFYWCPNMEGVTRKALLQTCFNFIPQKLVGQFLESHDSPDGLSNAKGTFLYADPDVLGRCKVPCLGINGDWDLFCPAAGGEKNVNLFAGPKKHITLGPAFGQQQHYGHFDVVVGKNAQRETWPHIQDWLDAHDAPAGVSDLWIGVRE